MLDKRHFSSFLMVAWAALQLCAHDSRAAAFYNLGAFWSAQVTEIFRSIGPGNTSALATGSSNAVTISGATATFTNSLPDNIGVGDAIQYQVASTWHLAFIASRTSATVYTLQTASGGVPTAASANTSWSIFRAYTSTTNAFGSSAGTANTAINSSLRPFDTSGGSNLVTAKQQMNFAIYADSWETDASSVTLSTGWTTGANNIIRIYVPYLSTDVGVTQRHNGAWSSTAATLNFTSLASFGCGLSLNNAYVWLDGLQIEGASTTAGTSNQWFLFCTGSSSGSPIIKVSNGIFFVNATSSDAAGVAVSDNSSATFTGLYWNNVVFAPANYSTIGFDHGGSSSTAYFYNNTAVNVGIGFNNFGGTAVAKNDVSQGTSLGYNGTFSSSSNYNISNSGGATGGANDTVNATVTFNNPSSNDYRLSMSDTVAKGAGTNLSSDPNLSFSTDNQGLTRTSPWDIGASKPATNQIYRSVGGTTAMLACGTTTGGCVGLGNLTISGTTGTFATGLDAPSDSSYTAYLAPGQGDVIVYDCTNSGSLGASSCIAFISGIQSLTSVTLQSASGGTPTAMAAHAVWQIYRAYTSLANAVDATVGGTANSAVKAITGSNFDTFTSGGINLTTSNLQWNVMLNPDVYSDTTAVTIGSGWVTSATNQLVISPGCGYPQSIGCGATRGSWNSGAYLLSTTNSTALTINGANFVTISGMHFQGDDMAGSGHAVDVLNLTAGASLRFYNNLIKASAIAGSWATNDIFLVEPSVNSAANIYIYNNITMTDGSFSSTGEVICYSFKGGNVSIYNNTCYVPPGSSGSTGGIYAAVSTVLAKNNLMQKASAGGYTGTFASGSNYNLSDDATGTGGANDISSATVTFHFPQGYDYRLSGADTAAKGKGTNLSLDAYLPFTTDVHYGTRSTTWDIGASMAPTILYRSVGPGNTKAVCGKASLNGTTCSSTLTTNMTIATSGGISTATLASATMPLNIGVGDLIVYDCTGSGSLGTSSCLAFITGITTPQKVYTVQNNVGGTATAFAASQVWQIYRAYTSGGAAIGGTVNSQFLSAICSGTGAGTICNFENMQTFGTTWTNNLVTQNVQRYYAYYGDAADTYVPFYNYSGFQWTVGDFNYIKVYAPYLPTEVGVSQRHNGVWDNTKARIVSTGSGNTSAFGMGGIMTWVEGIQVSETYTTTSNGWDVPGIDFNGNNWAPGFRGITQYAIDNLLTVNLTDTYSSTTSGLLINGSQLAGWAETYAVNNIFYNGGSTYLTDAIVTNEGVNVIYNNTVYEAVSGFLNGADTGAYAGASAMNLALYKNNIVQGVSGGEGYNEENASCGSGSNYNVSSDTHLCGGANDTASATVEFENAGGDSFFLNPNDTVAYHTGENLSKDSFYQLTTDATQATRSGTWSRGALQEGTVGLVQYATTVTPSGGSTTAAMINSSANVAGDLIVVVVLDGGTSASGVSDSSGNTYTRVSTYPRWYASNIAAASAGSNTVTVSFSSSCAGCEANFIEYSGIATSNVLDTYNSSTGSSSGTMSTALTTSNQYDLLVGSGGASSGCVYGSTNTQDIYYLSPHCNAWSTYSTTATGSNAFLEAANSGTTAWTQYVAAFKKASTASAPILLKDVEASAQSSSPATTVCQYMNNIQTAGDTNIATVVYNSATTVSVSDTKNGAYTKVASVSNGSGVTTALFYHKNILSEAASTNDVCATFGTAPTNAQLQVYEYSGLSTSAPLDVSSSCGGSNGYVTATGSSSSTTLGSVTTSSTANELIFSMVGTPGTTIVENGISSGFRLLPSMNGNSSQNPWSYPADNVVTKTGTYTNNFSFSSSQTWSGITACFH